MQGMLWETSLLDPDEGIRFRGYSIPELQVQICLLTTCQLQCDTPRTFCVTGK